MLGQLVTIYINDRYFDAGSHFVQYENQANQLRLENEQLSNQIAAASSLKQIEQTAKLMGFQPIKQISWYK